MEREIDREEKERRSARGEIGEPGEEGVRRAGKSRARGLSTMDRLAEIRKRRDSVF